jgi:hypothetical protein
VALGILPGFQPCSLKILLAAKEGSNETHRLRQEWRLGIGIEGPDKLKSIDNGK